MLQASRGGFTLVEIMIVVVIIGLLAAIAIPAFQKVRLRSQASRMANDFKQFEAAFQRFVLENGSWPVATGMGLIPTGMNGYLPDGYTQVSPLGGQYLWSGPSQNIVLRGTQASDEVMQLVDVVLDDGVLTTGDFTKIGPNTFGYRAH
jgi:prepilin-type N-terminal cleavage/methylation domain-containing protein